MQRGALDQDSVAFSRNPDRQADQIGPQGGRQAVVFPREVAGQSLPKRSVVVDRPDLLGEVRIFGQSGLQRGGNLLEDAIFDIAGALGMTDDRSVGVSRSVWGAEN